MKLHYNNMRRVFLASGIAAVLIVAIYALRELYPFGGASLMCQDSWQLYMPSLYARYDALHGVGVAQIMQQTFSGGAFLPRFLSFLLNPLYWLCLAMPRAALPYYPNIMFALCTVLSTGSAAYCIEKLYPDNGLISTAFALSYGFCGFIIYSFVALPWMVLTPLFPLFILSLRKLLTAGSGLSFTLIAAYYMALNMQIGSMLMLFTLFGTGLYILLYAEKASRKELMHRVGVYTLAALLISGVTLLPNITALLYSSRAAENISQSSSLFLSDGITDLYDRLYMSLSPLALGIVVTALFKKRPALVAKGQGRCGGVCFAMLLLLVFTLICQPSNLLWHLGSYALFPARYGFMVNMVLLLVASEGVSNTRQSALELKPSIRKYRVDTTIAILLLMLSAVLCVLLQSRISFDTYKQAASVFVIRALAITAILLPLAIAGGFIYTLAKPKTTAMLAIAAASCYAFFGLYSGIYVNRDLSDFSAMQAMYEHNMGASSFIRMKEVRNTLNRNYGNVAGIATIGGFSASVDEDYVEDMLALGYTKAWTSVTSSGGTLLTDALLRNGYLLGVDEQDSVSDLYSVYKQFGSYTVYKNPYLFPPAFMTERNVFDVEYVQGSPFDNTNLLYYALSGSTTPIVAITDSYIEENQCYRFQVPADNSVLYLDAGAAWDNFTVYVDDKMIDMHDRFDMYSPHRVMELGLYHSPVIVTIVPNGRALDPQNIKIGALDVAMLEKLCSEYSERAAKLSFDGGNIRIDAYSPSSGYLFIPIRFVDEYRCYVNGRNCDLIPAFGSFVAVAIEPGESSIIISEGLSRVSIVGFIMSSLGIALLAALCIRGKKGIIPPKWWIGAVSFVYGAILGAGILLVYAVAFVGFCIALISKIAALI